MAASEKILLNLEKQEIGILISEFKKSQTSESEENEIFTELEFLLEENKNAESTLRFSNSYSYEEVSSISNAMANSSNEELKFYLKEHLSKFEKDKKSDPT